MFSCALLSHNIKSVKIGKLNTGELQQLIRLNDEAINFGNKDLTNRDTVNAMNEATSEIYKSQVNSAPTRAGMAVGWDAVYNPITYLRYVSTGVSQIISDFMNIVNIIDASPAFEFQDDSSLNREIMKEATDRYNYINDL